MFIITSNLVIKGRRYFKKDPLLFWFFFFISILFSRGSLRPKKLIPQGSSSINKRWRKDALDLHLPDLISSVEFNCSIEDLTFISLLRTKCSTHLCLPFHNKEQIQAQVFGNTILLDDRCLWTSVDCDLRLGTD